MRVIIAGGRDFLDYPDLENGIKDSGFDITEVVCGGASGADAMGDIWAKNHSVPVKMFPANWRMYGKSAGQVRNCHMAAYAEALIAFWDGRSKGTKHMIEEATKRGLRVHIHKYTS